MPIYKKQQAKSYKYRFTVFTPVYNCERFIEKVHNSLLNQTFRDFEWLIINDGSTDNSHEVITGIKETSPLSIRYINNKVNKHKMSCFVQSIELAEGEFLLPFDGDDECYPNALEIFNYEYETIPSELKHNVAAVTALCVNQYGNIVGEQFPEDPFYCNTFEAKMKKKILGEKWGFTKTDILKGVIVNDKIFSKGYIPESIIWNSVAGNGYLTKCINKPLRIYYIGVEDSIMNTQMSKNSFGAVLNGLATINWFFSKHFFKSPLYFLKTIYLTLRSSIYLDYKLKEYLKSIDPFIVKAMFLALWPFRKFMN